MDGEGQEDAGKFVFSKLITVPRSERGAGRAVVLDDLTVEYVAAGNSSPVPLALTTGQIVAIRDCLWFRLGGTMSRSGDLGRTPRIVSFEVGLERETFRAVLDRLLKESFSWPKDDADASFTMRGSVGFVFSGTGAPEQRKNFAIELSVLMDGSGDPASIHPYLLSFEPGQLLRLARRTDVPTEKGGLELWPQRAEDGCCLRIAPNVEHPEALDAEIDPARPVRFRTELLAVFRADLQAASATGVRYDIVAAKVPQGRAGRAWLKALRLCELREAEGQDGAFASGDLREAEDSETSSEDQERQWYWREIPSVVLDARQNGSPVFPQGGDCAWYVPDGTLCALCLDLSVLDFDLAEIAQAGGLRIAMAIWNDPLRKKGFPVNIVFKPAPRRPDLVIFHPMGDRAVRLEETVPPEAVSIVVRPDDENPLDAFRYRLDPELTCEVDGIDGRPATALVPGGAAPRLQGEVKNERVMKVSLERGAWHGVWRITFTRIERERIIAIDVGTMATAIGVMIDQDKGEQPEVVALGRLLREQIEDPRRNRRIRPRSQLYEADTDEFIGSMLALSTTGHERSGTVTPLRSVVSDHGDERYRDSAPLDPHTLDLAARMAAMRNRVGRSGAVCDIHFPMLRRSDPSGSHAEGLYLVDNLKSLVGLAVKLLPADDGVTVFSLGRDRADKEEIFASDLTIASLVEALFETIAQFVVPLVKPGVYNARGARIVLVAAYPPSWPASAVKIYRDAISKVATVIRRDQGMIRRVFEYVLPESLAAAYAIIDFNKPDAGPGDLLRKPGHHHLVVFDFGAGTVDIGGLGYRIEDNRQSRPSDLRQTLSFSLPVAGNTLDEALKKDLMTQQDLLKALGDSSEPLLSERIEFSKRILQPLAARRHSLLAIPLHGDTWGLPCKDDAFQPEKLAALLRPHLETGRSAPDANWFLVDAEDLVAKPSDARATWLGSFLDALEWLVFRPAVTLAREAMRENGAGGEASLHLVLCGRCAAFPGIRERLKATAASLFPEGRYKVRYASEL